MNNKKSFCENCEGDIIFDKAEVKICPNCGKPRKPCAVCGTVDKGFMFDGCRKDCPFEREYIYKVADWKRNNK